MKLPVDRYEVLMATEMQHAMDQAFGRGFSPSVELRPRRRDRDSGRILDGLGALDERVAAPEDGAEQHRAAEQLDGERNFFRQRVSHTPDHVPQNPILRAGPYHEGRHEFTGRSRSGQSSANV